MSKSMANDLGKEEGIFDESERKVDSIYLPIKAAFFKRGFFGEEYKNLSIWERRDIILGLGEKVQEYLTKVGYKTEVEVNGSIGPDTDIISMFKIKSLDGVVEGSIIDIEHNQVYAEFNFNSNNNSDRDTYEDLASLVRQIDAETLEKPAENKAGAFGISTFLISLLTLGGIVGYSSKDKFFAAHHSGDYISPILWIMAVGGILGGAVSIAIGVSSYVGVRHNLLESAIKELRERLSPKGHYPIKG